ncbi:MAG: hypothetical protein K2M19_03325 [Muribaculaceae bacterium]|nr:hypothetical protein [Muribaculaceae bacterium]
MNKLQLYITKSLRGFKNMRDINPSEDVRRHIHDVRNALEIIDYDPREKHLFYLISYIEEGAFFTILRTIPDKPLDHLASTIFVPAGVTVSRGEMASIVRATTRMVSNPAVTAEDLNALTEMLAREYPADAAAPAIEPSTGGEYAFCYYGAPGERRLDDFFGPGLYQPDFVPYAGVLLVDSNLGLQAYGIEAGREEEPAQEAEAPETVAPEPRYEPAAPEQEPEPEMRPEEPAKQRGRRRVYHFELPLVSDAMGAPVRFDVETKRALDESPVEGYEPVDKISEGPDTVNYLEYAGEEVSEGYSLKWLIYVASTAFIIGLLSGWAIFHKSAPKIVAGEQTAAVEAVEARMQAPAPAAEEPAISPSETPAPAEATPAPAAAQPAGEVTAEAIAYLDNNKKWTRAELEKHPSLRGLYDDMNNYRQTRLTDFWAKRLAKSKEFRRVAHHVGEGMRKKVFKPSGTYNSSGEETITVQSYLNRVDPANPAKK